MQEPLPLQCRSPEKPEGSHSEPSGFSDLSLVGDPSETRTPDTLIKSQRVHIILCNPYIIRTTPDYFAIATFDCRFRQFLLIAYECISLLTIFYNYTTVSNINFLIVTSCMLQLKFKSYKYLCIWKHGLIPNISFALKIRGWYNYPCNASSAKNK